MGKVNFFWVDIKPALKQRKKLKAFLNNLFINEKKALLSITYIFCSDHYLLEINRKFLKHDFYTDTITFDLSENAKATTGEIYISSDRVRENARLHCVSIEEELHRVIFHSALHLCGYKDKNPSDKLKMTQAENKYLQAYLC